jgi:hypothetical protein
MLAVTAPAGASPGDLDRTFAGDGILELTTPAEPSVFGDASFNSGRGNQVQAVGSEATPEGGQPLVAGFTDAGDPIPSFGPGGIVPNSSWIDFCLLACARGMSSLTGWRSGFVAVGAGGLGAEIQAFRGSGKPEPASVFEADSTLRLADSLGSPLTISGRRMLLLDPTRVFRITVDGSLDRTFGKNGIADLRKAVGRSSLRLWSLATDDQGRILVAGSVKGADRRQRIFLLRLRANGSLDPRFGQNGSPGVVLGTGYPGQVDARNRKIYLTANILKRARGYRAAVFALRDSTDPVKSFGRNGVRRQAFGTYAGGLEIAGVELFAAHSVPAGQGRWDTVVTASGLSGELDRTFGERGRATVRGFGISPGAGLDPYIARGVLLAGWTGPLKQSRASVAMLQWGP